MKVRILGGMGGYSLCFVSQDGVGGLLIERPSNKALTRSGMCTRSTPRLRFAVHVCRVREELEHASRRAAQAQEKAEAATAAAAKFSIKPEISKEQESTNVATRGLNLK